MWKQILGAIVGLIGWFVVVSVIGVPLRLMWPEYVAASADLSFTLAMQLARLAIGALTTVAAGAVTALIARSSRTAMVTGALLLLVFIPEHISLWDKFPVWYHLTFLASLVPLAVVGGRIAALARRPAAA